MLSWPRDAYVGQKVVFINNKNMRHIAGYPPDPVLNKIYELREIGLYKGECCVKLKGVFAPQPTSFYIYSDWYRAWRFRPVHDRPTDISIFTSILNKQHDKVDA